MNKLYCVWAYRYGNLNGYNFPVGLFETLEKAKEAANNHRQFRGGKYDHRIFSLEPGKEYDAEEASVSKEL